MKAELTVEYADKKVSQTELTKAIKKAYTKATGKKASDIKSLRVYLQPAEAIAYYVVNDDYEGSYNI